MREVFNQQRLVERVEAGELSIVVDESRPARNSSIRGWMHGTLSQSVLFLDSNGVLLAKAHRYLRPDGQLAASGKYDPKRVLWQGKYLILAAS